MKATRSELKAIVKECLQEILNEGLGAMPQNTGKMQRPVQQSIYSEIQKSTRQQKSETRTRQPSAELREAIRREAGGDKVMASILADTAASTLPMMLQSEGKKHSAPVPGGIAEQVVAAAAPEELFGEDVASRWANLAFMDAPTKK